MGFLHGVETLIIDTGSAPVKTVSTAVIALVGTAPQGDQNTLTLVTNPQDAEQFGGDLYPLTINRALKSIFAQGNCPVLVVNVFDPATMKTTITDESVTISNGKATLAETPLLLPVAPVVTTDPSGTTYVLGTDYTLSEYGVLKIIPSGDISEGDDLLITYNHPDTSGLAAADFIGTTSPNTGLKMYTESLDTFGFNPKLFIVPEYSSLEAVAIEMEAQAETFRGVCFVDDVNNTDRANLITNRQLSGKSFNSTSRRLIPCAPWHQAYDHAGTLADYPYSSWVAGITANTDRTEGFWVSPSNHTISGVSDAEYPMNGAGINDESSDANLLNAAGIVTSLKVNGSRRTWGNRSAAYPSEEDVRVFIPIQRTQDIIHESLELAKLPFIDKPLVQATIDAIKAVGNAYVSTLIQRGALLEDSEIIYDPADNPSVDLAAGHVKFRLIFMPPTPAERITYLSYIDISLLSNLS